MLQKIRKSKITKIAAVFIVLNLLGELVLPQLSYALTGGPSQPEVQSFEPIGTSEMVDLFSGDFKYNIPLIDVGGYPVNLSYQSGIGMDQEASWVGLGWNINPGVINRTMRGIPDDFNGEDLITKEMNLKPNQTIGTNVSIGEIEIIGLPISKAVGVNFGIGFGAFFNTYRGVGFERSIDANISIGNKNKGALNVGLGLTANSQQGIDVSPTVGLSVNAVQGDQKDAGSSFFSAKVGAPFNTRAGLKSLSLEVGFPPPPIKNSQIRGLLASTGPGSVLTSGQASAYIPVGTQTYTPQVQMPMTNFSAALSGGTGLELKWVNGKAHVRGYYNGQWQAVKRKESPAFGYLYSDKSKDKVNALLDFNREKDGVYSKSTPALPLTNFTYDIYSVTGQGVGGMYRPFRSDVGIVHDDQVVSTSTGINIGIDIGFTEIVKGGGNGGFNFNVTSSGNWSGGNGLENKLPFKGPNNNTDFEPFYFKQAGEMVPVEEAFHKKMGDKDPVFVPVQKNGNTVNNYKKVNIDGNTSTLAINSLIKSHREKRNQAINVLPAGLAKTGALIKSIESYPISNDINALPNMTPSEIVRMTDAQNASDDEKKRKKHHISEIAAYRPDGARYVYGIPAYNNVQKEVTFNVSKNGENPQCDVGLIEYRPGKDNSPANKNGVDHFFSATTTPAYAHSYLLTALLSPDYVDVTGDGPTIDDLGTYTKFNYTRVHDAYKWRVPFEANHANYSDGLKINDVDDKASYIYGTKEIWHLHSIETKTHIAQFYISPRKDGYGVTDENGGLDNDQDSYKLDRIELYAYWDRINNGTNAEPIKTVHFEYNYTLCPGIPNHKDFNGTATSPGKLTLKKVFFTFGKSNKGKLSPYKFSYSNYNPPYNLKGYDRWGNYKRNKASSCSIDDTLSNADEPYVEQFSRTQADKNASAWSLTKIELPSGGAINVDYEADDYAYVQDKRAMQMFKIAGVSSDENDTSPGNELYGDGLSFTPHNVIHIDLPEDPNTGENGFVTDAEDFRRKYLGDQRHVYFKFLTALKRGNEGDFEFVQGYADLAGGIQGYGVTGQPQDGLYRKAWIRLKSANVGDQAGSANPIAKAAWQFLRLHAPERFTQKNSGTIDNSEEAILSILGLIKDVQVLFTGYNRTLRRYGYGRQIKKDKCFIRLFNPINKKVGGGARVKRLTLSDAWGDMIGAGNGDNFEYGQEYTYRAVDESGNGMGSSGVAVYEPLLGNEENPLRQPVSFENENRLAPDDRFYQEEPYGETFFPGASVGYSRVEVKNLQRHQNNDPAQPLVVKRTATGRVVHEFYTARDFPIITRSSEVDRKPNPASILNKLLKIDIKDYMTVSQGYQIELNDMHGKPKAQWVYAEDQEEPISGVEYFYKTDADNEFHLNNKVSVIDKSGIFSDAVVGVEIDAVNDFRENKTVSTGMTLAVNVDVSLFPFPPIPIPIPSIWPSFSSEETRFRSAVTTKVITRYGILEKTVAHDLGSRVSTENIAYDGETGEVLLTKAQNEYDDPVYTFNYPAHWGYNRMGMAYKNLGIKFSGVNINNNGVYASSNSSFFVVGDEVLVETSSTTTKYWIKTIKGNSIELIDINGDPAESVSGTKLTIIRSGRRNLQSTPIGSVTALANPADNSLLSFNKILNANAIEYTDSTEDFCECGFDPEVDETFNPYTRGIAGNWRAVRSYAYLIDRQQSTENNNTNTRRDGIYNKFEPFWLPNKGDDWTTKSKAEEWQFTSEVTIFSRYGFELENKDALDRFSSALYGYNNSLPVGVASNAQYKEVGVDNFEDYDCDLCGDNTSSEGKDHFSFKVHQNKITEERAHSGRRSIKLNPGESVKIRKQLKPCVPVITVN